MTLHDAPSIQPTPLCARHAPLLALLRTDALAPDEATRVHEHLSTCLWCQREVGAYDALDVAARRQFGHIATRALKLEEIMDANTGSTGSKATTTAFPHSSRPRFLALGALAAALIVALLGSVLLVGYGGFSLGGEPTATSSVSPQSRQVLTFLLPEGVTARDITTGSDRNLWFTDSTGNAIGKMTPNGAVTMYTLSQNYIASSITTGFDGNLWFTESNTTSAQNRIGRMTPNGTLTEFMVSGIGCTPANIVRGADDTLWFTEGSAGTCPAVVHMTTYGSMQRFAVPNLVALKGNPAQAAVDASGNLWFTELDSSSKAKFIGKVTPAGILTEYPMPDPNVDPAAITLGPDHAIWFAAQLDGKIGRIASDGAVTLYTIPEDSGRLILPTALTTGADGNLWFADADGAVFGRVTTTGVMTLYAVVLGPNYPNFERVISGPDNNLWFTVIASGQARDVIGWFSVVSMRVAIAQY